MTGLVLWSTSEHQKSPAISMEFAYLRYDEVATARGLHDWSKVERLMSASAARGHQLILRLHDTYPRAGREARAVQWASLRSVLRLGGYCSISANECGV